jgi:hypothetical protein
MLSLPQSAKISLSSQATHILQILKYLCATLLFISCLLLFVDLHSGISLVLYTLLYILVIWSKSWCMCLVYITICLGKLFSLVVDIGNYFARNSPSAGSEGFALLLHLILVPVYLLVIYYTFLAYRELKALSIEAGTSGSGYGIMDRWYSNNARNNSSQRNTAFSGRGYKLG